MAKSIIDQIRAEIERLRKENGKDGRPSHVTEVICTHLLSILDTPQEPEMSCKTCGFYENNCPFIRGKLIPYPNKVCKDYTFSAMKAEAEPKPYDEDYLNSKIAKASESWKGVDVDKFMDEVRGREPEDLEEEEEESWRMKYRLWEGFADIDDASYQYAYDMSNDWAQEKPTWKQVQDSFKAGAKWMANQGETIEDEVGICQDAEMTPLIEVCPKTFKAGDKVIVQIRKK